MGMKESEFLNPASQRVVARIGFAAGAMTALVGLMNLFSADWSNAALLSFFGLWCLADSVIRLRRNQEPKDSVLP
jgi:uncharacterized membrane protein HdeD (DUF308 family)